MKKRVIWKMLVLEILTLGIYRLYWFVKTRKEMMKLNPNVKIMSPWFFVIPVLLIVVPLVLFVTYTFQSAANLPEYCKNIPVSQTLPVDCNASPSLLPMILFYVALIFVGPLIALWLWGYSKAVDTITKGRTNFAIAMIVLLLVPDGIDILIVQDAFNKLK